MTKPYGSLLGQYLWESPITQLVDGAATIIVPVFNTDKSNQQYFRHFFAGIEFYSTAQADEILFPTSGVATVTIETPVLPGAYMPFALNSLCCSDIEFNAPVNWGCPTTNVKATMENMVGASYVTVRIMGMSS